MELTNLTSQRPCARRKRARTLRRLGRVMRHRKSGDDEDPPPFPAAVGLPRRSTLVDARMRPPRSRSAACRWAVSAARRSVLAADGTR